MIKNYYLGCPGWGTKGWVGRLFPPGARATEFLGHYAKVFNSVEGNTTFYALPTPDTVARWRDQVPSEFRFCFKFPRAISHTKLLVQCEREVDEFLGRIEPLGSLLGTLMLQLPPRCDGTQLARLAGFLDALPRDFTYAVEPRHEEFFTGGDADAALQALLHERKIDLVVMDTRGLHRTHSLQLADVRGRKPALPVIMRTTANRPIVRFVPHEAFAESTPEAIAWAAQVARWIAEGRRPYFFMHSPDDTVAPENAYAFHARLAAQSPVGDLPAWPGAPRQLSLI
ncbi:DUF72 domain-containing protein [soil metagenome]